MNFKSLVKFITSQGCRVRLYKTQRVEGAFGLFYEDPPRIKMATKNKTKKELVSILLHEYGHFCQLRDGFSDYIDGICWPHNIHEEWVAGDIELTEREIKMVRATMLSIEYDAEMRAIKVGLEIKPDNFNMEYHLKEAQSYMAAIKWSFKHRRDWKRRPLWNLYPAKRLTPEKLFAPMTRREKKILKGMVPL